MRTDWYSVWGVAAGEVAARSAHIGHEERIAHEHRITHLVGHAGRGVAGHRQRLRLQGANRKGVAVFKQVVELAAVGSEFRLQMEDALEHVLHLGDLAADGNFAAQVLAQIGRRREVVGMGMGFQNPVHRQVLLAHESDQLIG